MFQLAPSGVLGISGTNYDVKLYLICFRVGITSPEPPCTAEKNDPACDRRRKCELLSCTLEAVQMPQESTHSSNYTTNKSACCPLYVDSIL